MQHYTRITKAQPSARGRQWSESVKRTPCRTNRAGYCQCRCGFNLARIDQSQREPVMLTQVPRNHQRAMDQAADMQLYSDDLIIIVPVATE